MDNFISTFLNNPESIGFPVLFVFLLVWVMKQNNAREERYLNTIDDLTESLKQVERIETTVNRINERAGEHEWGFEEYFGDKASCTLILINEDVKTNTIIE